MKAALESPWALSAVADAGLLSENWGGIIGDNESWPNLDPERKA